MKKLIMLIAILALASGAVAQIDPDVDMMGIYFDTNATIVCTDLALYTPTPAYVCITNASASSGVAGFECAVLIQPTPAIPPTYNLLGSGALNVSTAPDFVVGIAAPMSWMPSIPVVEIIITPLSADPIYFTLLGAATSSFGGLPGYAAGDDPGDLRSCGYSTNIFTGYSAVANMGPDCGVIPAESHSWGGVKNLFK